MLKDELKYTDPSDRAWILRTSKGEDEIRGLDNMLKYDLKYTDPAHRARIIGASKGEDEIRGLDNMLKKYNGSKTTKSFFFFIGSIYEGDSAC